MERRMMRADLAVIACHSRPPSNGSKTTALTLSRPSAEAEWHGGPCPAVVLAYARPDKTGRGTQRRAAAYPTNANLAFAWCEVNRNSEPAYRLITGSRRQEGAPGPCRMEFRAVTGAVSVHGGAIVLGCGRMRGKSLLVTVRHTREPAGNT